MIRLKVCLNGGRRRGEHPAVPVGAAELAGAAAGAVAAGADAVHAHPRRRDGSETLDVDGVAAAVTAVRAACPGTPVGVSTGLWICFGDVTRRLALVAGWAGLAAAERPDFASVNLSEPGADDLAATLAAAGIGVEAGVWTPADAGALAVLGTPVERILVEILDASDGPAAVTAADAVLARLDAVGATGPRLLHGEGTACWPLLARAGRLGLATRIGLEDTLVGPSGEPAVDNADLVRHALAVLGR